MEKKGKQGKSVRVATQFKIFQHTISKTWQNTKTGRPAKRAEVATPLLIYPLIKFTGSVFRVSNMLLLTNSMFWCSGQWSKSLLAKIITNKAMISMRKFGKMLYPMRNINKFTLEMRGVHFGVRAPKTHFHRFSVKINRRSPGIYQLTKYEKLRETLCAHLERA